MTGPARRYGTLYFTSFLKVELAGSCRRAAGGSGLVERNKLQSSSESFASSWSSRRVDDVPGPACSQDHRCRGR
jgi:hypothetical protein